MDSERPVLSPQLLQELADCNPFGVRVQPAEVEAWWEQTWPRYRLRRYRLHGRAIREWWGRARYNELHMARALLIRRESAALSEQESRLREDVDLRALDARALSAIFRR